MSFLKCSLLLGAVTAVAARSMSADPLFPSSPDTTPYCSWWGDYKGMGNCASFLQDNVVSLEDFLRWNPSVPNPCVLQAQRSYCVEAFGEPAPGEPQPNLPSTTLITTTTATTNKPSGGSETTKPTQTIGGNGVVTPLPIQPSMVSNCNKFHWIANSNVKCADVLSYQKITLADFAKWNPSVNSDCSGMWSGVQVCVGVIGGASPTTTTTAGNGVETPQPTQPGMVSNCNKFHWIANSNVKCDDVISYQKINRADFVKWNPTVLSDCSGMWAGVQVCVGVIAGSSPTTTTTAGNGVQTPQPTQPGMVSNCNKFHWIAKNVNCDQVISYQKITRADFVKWNPTVLDDCRGMWAEVNVCVGVIGGSPAPTTTTTAGNGIQTPQPIQPGMVTNCKKFHWIANSNVKCQDVISYQKITLADFAKWNTGVGSDCRNMWSGVHQCVGV
ncbi:hypothetical protein ACHAPU_011103 [Fusarium lateritium]